MKQKIIIVGAGPGGLTAAMILAARGFQVTILEKSSMVGGRNACIEDSGYKFDIGPTFLMMKFILDEMFVEAGERADKYLDFLRLEPMYRLIWSDMRMEMSEDHQIMRQQIAKNFPGQEDNLDRFLEQEAKKFSQLFPCLQSDYCDWYDLFNENLLKATPYILTTKSLFDYLGNYFAPDKLRLAFTFQAKYLGMSPWQCPAFFSILSYIEHRWGVYHVKGGLSEISQAMAKVAQAKGAELRLNTEVAEVITENDQAIGVRLTSGEKLKADEVIINADFSYAMQHLFPNQPLKKYTPAKLKKKKYSCSTLMFYWGVDREFSVHELEHHNVFFAKDYRKNVEGVFAGQMLSDDFSFYVRNASLNDDSLAPKGKSAIYVLVPAANLLADLDWPANIDRIKALILQRLGKELGVPNLKTHIEVEHVISPDDWQSDYNVQYGATFNLGHNITQMLYFRPRNRFEELGNTWLVGGGTHPGSGLPTIYESGRISANLISNKYGVDFKKPLNLKDK